MDWIDRKDDELITQALTYWANHIETGDICFSSLDLHNMGDSHKLKALSLDQMKLIIRLRELAQKKRN